MWSITAARIAGQVSTGWAAGQVTLRAKLLQARRCTICRAGCGLNCNVRGGLWVQICSLRRAFLATEKWCAGCKHYKGCQCTSEHFQRTARIKHTFVLLEADATNDTKTYAEIMLQLGQHHCRHTQLGRWPTSLLAYTARKVANITACIHS